MSSIHPLPKTNERQYPYRNAWSSTLVILATGGIGSLGSAWLAISEKTTWLWFLVVLFSLLLLFGIWVATISISNKLRFIISEDGIKIPSIWQINSYTFIPFREISNVDILTVQGNTILQLSVGNKKYAIAHSWFPSQNDFHEIIDTIQARLK